MKKFILVLMVVILLCKNTFTQISFGYPQKINEEWKFILKDEVDAQTPNFNEKQWQTVDLPHDWSVHQPLSPNKASCMGFLPGGVGWYRKKIDIPIDKNGEKVFIYFEGIYNRSEVFVNGQLVGSRPNGYISFAFDITPYVQFGKENVIAVRVDHKQEADSRWYTGSGIYRNVWLVYSNPIHIAQWGVFCTPQPAFKLTNFNNLDVSVEVANESLKDQSINVVNELLSPEGKLEVKSSKKLTLKAGQNTKFTIDLKVKHPELWDLEHPTLYSLKTLIFKDGKVIDETTTSIGFRYFTFSPDKGFALNGKWIKMKGVCLHHDAGVLGSAVPREVWKSRLLALKEIGVNSIRTSHNPQAPDFYDLCDEIGLLVLNEAYDEWEFPKNKWVEGWNEGEPVHQGSFDIFAKWSETDLADMVRRDRNHVSVFAWSIGNEVDYPNDPYSHPILDGDNKDFTQKMFGGYKPDAPNANRLGNIAKRLVSVVKQYDNSRPVTAGLAGVAMSNETEYPESLDIQGYNYTESRYVSDHKKYPQRMLFGSETRHDLAAWKAVTDNEHVFGQFIWTGIDYLGESGRWPSRGFYSGLVDFAGLVKPRGYFRKSLWSNRPNVYLGTLPSRGDRPVQLSMDALPEWNYSEGQDINILCYTNTAKVQLLLNNQIFGNKKEYDPKTGIISWNLPFKPGKLEAVGYDKNDNEIARYAIQTSKEPFAIKIISNNTENGLSQILLQVVDEDGIPVMLSDNEITCLISGPGKLLGLEAGNNNDMGDYTDNKQRVYNGRLLAYIRATGEQGEIKVTFSSPWLQSAEAKIGTR